VEIFRSGRTSVVDEDHYCLNSEVQEGRRFAVTDMADKLDMKCMDAMRTWLRAKPKIFFADDIRKLVDSGNECEDSLGDYVEK
jgi:hypothetical protein